MENGRLHWFLPEELAPEQRRLYDEIVDSPRAANRKTPLTDDAGRLHGPFNALLTAPSLGEQIQALGRALRFSDQLPRVVFESIVLVVAAERRSAYEWYAHAPIARAAGLTDAQLAAIHARRYQDLTPVIEPDLLELVLAALRHETPSADTVRAVEQAYDTATVTAVVATVGYYDLLASLMRTWDTQLPEGAVDPFV